MPPLTQAELATLRDYADEETLTDTITRAGRGILITRLLDEHAALTAEVARLQAALEDRIRGGR